MTLILDKLPVDILAGNKVLIRRHEEIFSSNTIDFLKEFSLLLLNHKNKNFPEIQILY